MTTQYTGYKYFAEICNCMLVGQARRNGWPAAERNKKGSAGFAKIHYKVKRPMLTLPRLTAGSKDQSSIGGANNATGKSSQAITSFHFFDFFNISNFYHLNFYQQITCIIRFYRKEKRGTTSEGGCHHHPTHP